MTEPHPTGPSADETAPPHPLSLKAPATRREVFLFGLLLLGIAWLSLGERPRIVHVIPDPATVNHRVG